MKYVVGSDCIGCGMCTGICENVFSLSDDGVAVAIEDDVAEADLEAAADAKDSCPVSAIEEA